MELVREAVDLARRAARDGETAAGAANRRRKSSSHSQQQEPSPTQTQETEGDDALAKLVDLLPSTPADQLVASLEAASSSSAGELKVRGGELDRKRGTKRNGEFRLANE